MTGEQVLFWIFAALTCGGAVAVVVSQNIVRMAFWLVMSLGSVAGLFFLLHADFVAATQLLVYVGGTVVLLIFGVMLTASGPYVRMKTSAGEALLAGAVGLSVLMMVYATVLAVPQETWGRPGRAPAPDGMVAEATGVLAELPIADSPEAEQGGTVRPLGFSLLGLRPDKDLGAPGDRKLSTGFLLPFEIVSVHLLVVLVGAAYLARAKRRKAEDGPEENKAS